jgi:hypothetical protein
MTDHQSPHPPKGVTLQTLPDGTVNPKYVDLLDEDKPIRGQNYVCLSFLSPEDVLKNKDLFYFERYLKGFAKELEGLFKGIEERYPDAKDLVQQLRENNAHFFKEYDLEAHYRFFKTMNEEDIEREFKAKHPDTPTVRGIKVRGVFADLR